MSQVAVTTDSRERSDVFPSRINAQETHIVKIGLLEILLGGNPSKKMRTRFVTSRFPMGSPDFSPLYFMEPCSSMIAISFSMILANAGGDGPGLEGVPARQAHGIFQGHRKKRLSFLHEVWEALYSSRLKPRAFGRKRSKPCKKMIEAKPEQSRDNSGTVPIA